MRFMKKVFNVEEKKITLNERNIESLISVVNVRRTRQISI